MMIMFPKRYSLHHVSMVPYITPGMLPRKFIVSVRKHARCFPYYSLHHVSESPNGGRAPWSSVS